MAIAARLETIRKGIGCSMPYQAVGKRGLRIALGVCLFLVYAYVIKIANYAFSGWVDFLFMLLTLGTIFLLAIYWILPKAMAGKRYPLVYIILGFMLADLLVFVLSIGISILLGGFVWDGNWDISNYEHVFMAYIATNLFSLLYYMVRHGILNWGEQQRQHVELLKLRQQVARQQFFPHFMKNTLSALRALSRRDRARSIRCADLLTALFMYCVKNRDTRFVLLEEELEQVDRLLEIYSLRQDDSDIMLDIRMGLGISKKTSIPYMLLLTLIENACEYGICTDEHRPILVDIFCITPGSLTIRVMNWIPEVQKHNPAATGQGLKLLQDYVVALDPKNTICVEQAGQCFEVVITLHIVSF